MAPVLFHSHYVDNDDRCKQTGLQYRAAAVWHGVLSNLLVPLLPPGCKSYRKYILVTCRNFAGISHSSLRRLSDLSRNGAPRGLSEGESLCITS